jgi:hydroxyacylglutathione hydrolase
MKRTIKRVFVGIIVLLLLMILFFVWYQIKARSETKIMTPAQTGNITESVYSIRDSFVNLYLIGDSDRFIAVDAGNNAAVVGEQLKKLGISPDRIEAVLLTHTDGDHVAALKLFTKARVYLSKAEEQLLTGKKSRFLCFGTHIAAKTYTTLEDGQVICIGKDTIRCMLLPGHTVGSMCYQINRQYLFTGDAISLKNNKMDRFNEFFNSDTKMATRSMSRLTAVPGAAWIFTAHYGYTHDYQGAVKNWK